MASRIAFLLHAPSGGGAQRRTIDLAAALAGRGLAPRLLFVDQLGPLAGVIPADLPVEVLGAPPGPRGLQCAAAIPALARRLRADPPDVLVAAANHVHLTALAAHALAGRPCRLVMRASNHLAGGGRGRPARDWLRRRLARLYSRADLVVAVSADIARQARALAPSARVETLPNPVVADGFAARMAQPLKHPWLPPRQVPVVLGVGRLDRQKDFPTLLRAAARIGARVIILGDGPSREYLEQLGRALNIWVDLPGHVADPLPWMAQCSAYCLSSAWEGLPGALIEAMACGTPVVATDCPGGAAELLEDGRLAPLVPVGDDAAMAEALAAVLRKPPPPEALKRKAAEHSVAASAQAWARVLLSPSPRGGAEGAHPAPSTGMDGDGAPRPRSG